MFKLLLATRYLRTRYIALASIVSVMLGVATMVVVNSVMSGFRTEMYERLHGILSDVVVASHGLDGIDDSVAVTSRIREVLGDDLDGITTTVHVPAVLSYRVFDQWETRQVNLIGIDDATYASVSDFSKFLLHPGNRNQLSFELRSSGYDQRIRQAGWSYRRWRTQTQRNYEQAMERAQAQSARMAPSSDSNVRVDPHVATASHETVATDEEPALPFDAFTDPTLADEEEGTTFDPMIEQHAGIVLGIAISNIKHRDAAGEMQDYFLCQPGDDVQLTFPSSGAPPTAVHADFTVVDFYESKMSEYDSSFAFCPLSKLQELRGMIDPMSGKAAVTSIQMKLAEGADLAGSRDRLRAAFPVEQYRYRIETWKDMQGPLLAAVQWETTILNILLFLIIGVAGFGIFATFFMIVVEKTKDIGILKSLGAPGRGVMSIFLSYGFALGIVGSGVGAVIGVLFRYQDQSDC